MESFSDLPISEVATNWWDCKASSRVHMWETPGCTLVWLSWESCSCMSLTLHMKVEKD